MLLLLPVVLRMIEFVPFAPSCGPITRLPAAASVKRLTLEIATVLVTPPPLLTTMIVPLVVPLVLSDPTIPLVVAEPTLKTWLLRDCTSIVPPFPVPVQLALREPFTSRVPLPGAGLPANKLMMPPLALVPRALTLI